MEKIEHLEQKMMSEEAKKYLDEGYWFSMTMKGMQNELIKVDLTNGEEVIRIMIMEGFDPKYHTSVKVLQTRKYHLDKEYWTLWNDEGELLAETVFKNGRIIECWRIIEC